MSPLQSDVLHFQTEDTWSQSLIERRWGWNVWQYLAKKFYRFLQLLRCSIEAGEHSRVPEGVLSIWNLGWWQMRWTACRWGRWAVHRVRYRLCWWEILFSLFAPNPPTPWNPPDVNLGLGHLLASLWVWRGPRIQHHRNRQLHLTMSLAPHLSASILPSICPARSVLWMALVGQAIPQHLKKVTAPIPLTTVL